MCFETRTVAKGPYWRIAASIEHRNSNEDIFGRRFRIFYENIKVPVPLENAGINQFVFGLASVAAPVPFDQRRVGKRR